MHNDKVLPSSAFLLMIIIIKRLLHHFTSRNDINGRRLPRSFSLARNDMGERFAITVSKAKTAGKPPCC